MTTLAKICPIPEPVFEAALREFHPVAPSLSNRSDRRALWMVCIGIALCRQDPARLEGARRCLDRWSREQPSRQRLFGAWRQLLQSTETLVDVIDPTPENQQFRSVCPLAGSLRPGEHLAALRFFQNELYPHLS